MGPLGATKCCTRVVICEHLYRLDNEKMHLFNYRCARILFVASQEGTFQISFSLLCNFYCLNNSLGTLLAGLLVIGLLVSRRPSVKPINWMLKRNGKFGSLIIPRSSWLDVTHIITWVQTAWDLLSMQTFSSLDGGASGSRMGEFSLKPNVSCHVTSCAIWWDQIHSPYRLVLCACSWPFHPNCFWATLLEPTRIVSTALVGLLHINAFEHRLKWKLVLLSSKVFLPNLILNSQKFCWMNTL